MHISAWFADCSLFSPCSAISHPPRGGFHQLKQSSPKATDGQRQTRPDSGSPSQLLWHVRHAGMPCHSPLLHCNKGWADSPLERQAQVARRDVRRDGAPVSRPRVHPQTFFQSRPYFLPSSSSEPSVYLILLQFHLSPPKTSNQHPLRSLKNSLTHIPLCIFLTEVSPQFFPSPDLTRSQLLPATSWPLTTPTTQSLHPPRLLSRGVYFTPWWLDRLWVISHGGGWRLGRNQWCGVMSE